MAIKISKKIKGYAVVKADEQKTGGDNSEVVVVKHKDPDERMELRSAEVIQMTEQVERPDVLIGETYKIKSPLFEHALYVTINDIVLNHGTPHEARRPFEIFINSKNMDHFQWIVALTRIMSAVFRKGGDISFLVEEMKAVFDPRGGYFKQGGIYMPSIVAEIGAVVEDHLKQIGMIHTAELSDVQRQLIADKRAAYESSLKKKSGNSTAAPSHDEPAQPHDTGVGSDGEAKFPASATMCHKCNTKAMIVMDGCGTCLSCGYSKCG